MNPKYHLLAAIAALSLGACSTDDTFTGPENEGCKLSFTVAEDSETRLTLDTGDILRWVPTDQVGIYTVGRNVNPNILTVADVDRRPVEFIGVLKNLVSPGDLFYAYYPYDAAQSTDPAAVKLTIPAEQKQTKAGVYNGESHPLVALPMKLSWVQDGYDCRMNNVRFRQLGAIVELQFYSSDEALRSESIRSVTFESDTPLAGDFSFDLTTVTIDGEPTITGYESKVATTLLEEPAAIPAAGGEAARVYLTIAPGEYSGQIVVKTDAAQYTFRLAKTMTFERAVIKGLPADLAKAERKVLSSDDPVSENDPIHFEDPVVKEICIENWDTNGDGELSYKEAADVTSIGSQFKVAQTLIRSFNELQYFTGLRSIENSAFSDYSSLTSIRIPDGVTTIGWGAFSGCSNLANINIPEGVTEIEDVAFSGCSSLTKVHLPNRVTTINHRVFRNCSSLTSINIPDEVTKIGSFAFEGCSSLTSINIPDGVNYIGEGAFKKCSSLTSIVVPKEVTMIEVSTFEECSSLTSVNIPDGVTEIGSSAFYDCSSLASINIPKTVSSIGEHVFEKCSSLSAFYGKFASADNRYLVRYGTLFAFAPGGLTEYTIPDGVVAIAIFAFQNCSNLKSITIPNGIKEIGGWAFLNCSSLTSIYCKPTTPPSLGEKALWNTSSSLKIYVPAALVEVYKTDNDWRWHASQIFAE